MSDTVLYGGISNTVYIWQASDEACDECLSLDGQEFSNIDNIPDRPHPNCKCTIEEKDDDDLCDCGELYDELEGIIADFNILESEIEEEINDIEITASEAESKVTEMEETLEVLEEEVGQHLPDCEYNVDIPYAEISAQKFELEMRIRDILSLLNPLYTLIATISDFVSNYIELLAVDVEGIDKYYHSRANCQAAQRGILGSVIAEALSDLKEVYDSYTYVHTHKVSVEEALKDSEEDQVANRLGRERGRQYPTCNCSVLMWDLRPEEVPEYTKEEIREKIIERTKKEIGKIFKL